VNVQKPGLYRIIYRYVNPTPDDVTADVTVTPEASGDVTQTSHVTFEPTTRRTGPQFTTVSTGSIVTTFVLNPGPLSVALKALPGVLVVSITCLSVCLSLCVFVGTQPWICVCLTQEFTQRTCCEYYHRHRHLSVCLSI